MFKLSTVVKMLAAGALLAGFAQAGVIHETTKWQSLGKETIKDGDATNSNNGLFWRLSSADAWTQAVSGTEFDLNQTVQFKVDVWKEFQGTHTSDVAKVWVDGTEKAKGEWALATNGNTKKIGGTTYKYYDGNVTDGSQTTGNPEFLGSMTFSYTFSEDRDYSIVARTMCSTDLSKLNTLDGNPKKSITYVGTDNKIYTKDQLIATNADWAAFTATNPGTTQQGEIECYTFGVKTKQVPEPGLISLLGFGLIGLVLARRKKK